MRLNTRAMGRNAAVAFVGGPAAATIILYLYYMVEPQRTFYANAVFEFLFGPFPFYVVLYPLHTIYLLAFPPRLSVFPPLRGLALSTAAVLILSALGYGLSPVWDEEHRGELLLAILGSLPLFCLFSSKDVLRERPNLLTTVPCPPPYGRT